MKALVVVLVVAVAGYFVWQRYYSREGRINAAYRTCMKKVEAATGQAKSEMAAKFSETKPGDPAAALAKGMGDAATGMMSGFGGAMCGMIKEVCTKDFDGPICQAALQSK